LAQFLTEIPPRYALPPFFKGGQGGICSRSVMKCTNVAWFDLGCKVTPDTEPELLALEPEDIHLEYDLGSVRE
jgi:hypothetical protein